MRVVPKPWGREVWWAETPFYLAKILHVEAGHRTSLQFHREKTESLLVIAGRGEIEVGPARVAVAAGCAVDLPAGVHHRIAAASDLTIFEVSTPHPADVVRLEDAYGRAPGAPPEGEG